MIILLPALAFCLLVECSPKRTRFLDYLQAAVLGAGMTAYLVTLP